MAKKRITTYTFDASERTITFSGAMELEGFLVITNVVDNIIIYNFADPTAGGSVTGAVLTLDYDTTSMSDSDELQILYDDGVETLTVDTQLDQALTNTELRATPVPVSGTVTADIGANNDVTVTSGAITETNSEAIKTAVEAIQAGQLADGHNVTVDNASIAVTGTFWQATQPVSGTVTANLSATDNAVLDDIAADTESIKGYTDGIEGLLGTIDGDTGAIKTAVEVIDNAISGSEMQVDVITMPTTTVEATDLDIRDLSESSDSVAIYGSDDGGTTKRIIKTDAEGAIQMDIEVAEVTANAGTNLNTSALALETGGNLAAIKTNTDDIKTLLTTIEGNQLADGHNVTVDNASIAVTGTVTANLGATDSAVLDNIDSNTDFGAIVGGGTEAGALRVTLANNSTGVVSVDDNGGSLTVDGTVTANLSATDNAVLDDIAADTESIKGYTDGIETVLGTIDADTGAIKTAVETIDNAISGTEMQVDVVGALPTGTNSIGNVGHNISGIGHGVKTVTTAGTDVALAASTTCKKVDIQAQTDNTGIIAVGGSGVDATVATGTGLILEAGDVYSIEIDNLADVYIDSSVDGEGVRFTYFT